MLFAPQASTRAFRSGLAVLVAVHAGVGCASNTYRVSHAELARLAQLPPDQRGQRVVVEEELSPAETEPQPVITTQTNVVIATGGGSGGPPAGRHAMVRDHRGTGSGAANTRPSHGSGRSGGSSSGGSAEDAKAAAIAIVLLAVTAVITVAAVRGSQYIGEVALHPMQPVHLFGYDGQYAVVPVSAIDAGTAAWAASGVIAGNEGPVQFVRRRPLWRRGATYSVLMGSGALAEASGRFAYGPATNIALGYFFTPMLGVLGNVQMGWRESQQAQTVFAHRWGAQVQFLPLQAGAFSTGLFGEAALGQWLEDGAEISGRAGLGGGLIMQLGIHTNLALTARAGVFGSGSHAQRELMLGLAVF